MSRCASLICGLLFVAAGAAPALSQNTNPYPRPSDASANDACVRGSAGPIVDPENQPPRVGSTLKCGYGSIASVPGAVAVGYDAVADAAEATAFGYQPWARAPKSTAVGANATAAFAGSTALGAGTNATAANQVALGGAGTSVRVGDIAASTIAQVGTVAVATVDSTGTLGRDTTIIPTVQGLQSTSMQQASQLSSLGAAQSALGGRVDALFDLRTMDRRELRSGVAAAIAIGHASMPSASGRTSYVVNVSTFRGRQAVGGSFSHRLNSSDPLAISAGFSFAGNRNNAARVGMAGEF